MVNRSRQGQQIRGFTLIELIVALVVVAILAALAVPSFKYLIAQSEMRAVSTALSLTMTRARSEATKRVARVTVVKKSAWINGWRILDSVDGLILDQGPVAGVTFTSAPTGLTYMSSGRVSGNPTPQFSLTSQRIPTIERCVSIDASGGSSIREGAC